MVQEELKFMEKDRKETEELDVAYLKRKYVERGIGRKARG